MAVTRSVRGSYHGSSSGSENRRYRSELSVDDLVCKVWVLGQSDLGIWFRPATFPKIVVLRRGD